MEISRQRIKEAFSKNAQNYDVVSDLQRDIAGILYKKIQLWKVYPEKILDVGVGTGFFCDCLSKGFVNSQIFGCDISFEMTRQARQKRLLPLGVAEAENLPYKDAHFDLVTSNVSYQWSRDLKKSFAQVYRALTPGGSFCFSIFGKDTFSELKFSIKNSDLNSASIRLASEDFPDFESLKSHLVMARFHDVEAERWSVCRWYLSLMDLLFRLKKMGSNLGSNLGIKGLGWRKVLREIEREYRDRFGKNGRIPATYEVFFAKAKR